MYSVKSYNHILYTTWRGIAQPTTPLSPPSQGGEEGEVKKLHQKRSFYAVIL